MDFPFQHKGRIAAQVAAEIWFRARLRGSVPRRTAQQGRLPGRQRDRAFFASAEAPSGLGLPAAERARILEEAEAALGGTLNLLGLGPVHCGQPIDWRRDPATGARFPKGLLDIERDESIDWKFSDEVNKLRHFYALAQGYALSGDERYQTGVLEQLRAWLAANPPINDRFWIDGLECGIRLVAWLWVLHLLESRAPLEAEESSLLVGAVRQHARFVESDLAPYHNSYNHLVARAGALAMTGAALPSLPESSRWLGTGLDILGREAVRQFGRGGGHREQSIGYHVFLLEIYTQVVLLCGSNGITVPPVIVEALERMYEFVLALMRPDGRLPQLGDEAIAWHQLSRRPLLDARRLLSTGAVLFARPDMKWAAGEFSADSAWLLGREGGKHFAALECHPPAWTARHLEDAGLVVWRQSWEPRSAYFIFDSGPQGVELAGHGHADALSFELFAHGAPLIVDTGTFTYYLAGGWRRFFRGTAGHNTVAVDGADQAVAAARRFRWARTADARLRQLWTTPWLAFADGAHDGYQRLPEPVQHRRLVFWVARQYWLVYDILTGAGSHTCESHFHFSPVSAVMEKDGLTCSLDVGGSGLRILPLLDPGLEARLVCGETDPPQGWISRAYGHKEAAPVLVYRRRGALPLAFAAVLVPWEKAPPRVQLSRLQVSRQGEALPPSKAVCVRVELEDGTIDHLSWCDGGGSSVAGDLATDAEVSLLRLRPGASPIGVCLPGGELRWRGDAVEVEAGPMQGEV